MKKFVVLILTIAVILLSASKVSSIGEIKRVEGCIQIGDMSNYNVVKHKGIWTDIYEISNIERKFVLMVEKPSIDGQISDSPEFEFIECHIRSKIKIIEQLGKR